MSSSQDELHALVLTALALVAGYLYLSHLAGVGDVGAAVGLGVQTLDLDDPDNPHTLGHQVDLGTDEVRVFEGFFARQLVDLYGPFIGESLVRKPLYLPDDARGPLLGEGEVHPGAVRAHLAARYLRSEVPPDDAGEDVQGGVVAHVAVTPFPVQVPLELSHRVGDGVVEDVDDVAAFAPRVDHVSVDGADTQSPLVRRLAPAAGVEGGAVQDHLPPRELDHLCLELPHVGVLEIELVGHSARVPRSPPEKVTTSL